MRNHARVSCLSVDVPNCPTLKLHVYGVKNAKTPRQSHEQAYFVTVDGFATAVGELPADQRVNVRQLLESEYPAHARI